MERLLDSVVEGIPVGEAEQSQGRTVGEGEAALLHTLLWSLGPIHTDVTAAEAAGWPRLGIAGPVLAGLVTGLWVTGCSQIRRLQSEHGVRLLAELGTENRYPNPAHFGDTLRVSSLIEEARPSRSRTGKGVITFLLTGTNQQGEVVAEIRSHILFDRIPTAG